MTNADIVAKLEDIKLDAASLKDEIGRDDLVESQKYYAGQIIQKIEDLLNALKAQDIP